MSALLDENGLDRRAHMIAPGVWYYETRGGLELYWQPDRGPRLVCIIPWRSIKASLKRKEATR